MLLENKVALIYGAGGAIGAAVARAFAADGARAGRIDILFNAIGMDDVQGAPLTEMSVDDFMQPVIKAARTQFLTARTVGRQMAKQQSGVMLTLTAGPPEATPYIGGFGAACGAVEHLWLVLAGELGPKNVRVICLRSAGSPDSPEVDVVFRQHAAAAGISLEQLIAQFGSVSLLKRLPLVREIASAATLMASDRASAMTGTFLHVTCGTPTG